MTENIVQYIFMVGYIDSLIRTENNIEYIDVVGVDTFTGTENNIEHIDVVGLDSFYQDRKHNWIHRHRVPGQFCHDKKHVDTAVLKFIIMILAEYLLKVLASFSVGFNPL